MHDVLKMNIYMCIYIFKKEDSYLKNWTLFRIVICYKYNKNGLIRKVLVISTINPVTQHAYSPGGGDGVSPNQRTP